MYIYCSFIRHLKTFYFNNAFSMLLGPLCLPAPTIQCFINWLCARCQLLFLWLGLCYFYDYDYKFWPFDMWMLSRVTLHPASSQSLFSFLSRFRVRHRTDRRTDGQRSMHRLTHYVVSHDNSDNGVTTNVLWKISTSLNKWSELICHDLIPTSLHISKF